MSARRHAAGICIAVLGSAAREPGSPEYALLKAGVAYSEINNPARLDAFLARCGLESIMRRALREGGDLTSIGAAFSAYTAAPLQRAWAAGQIKAGLGVLSMAKEWLSEKQLLQESRRIIFARKDREEHNAIVRNVARLGPAA